MNKKIIEISVSTFDVNVNFIEEVDMNNELMESIPQTMFSILKKRQNICMTYLVVC